MPSRWKQTVWRSLAVVASLAAVTFFAAQGVKADTLTSPDYRLSPTVGNSFGGSFSSPDYSLTGSGGEAAIGDGSGGSYKIGAGFAAQLTHSISMYVEPAGLVGYWPMNEGAGDTVHDASGNSNDGTISGSPSWVTGKIGDALSFNGSNDIVDMGAGSQSTLNFGTSDFSVSFWINPASTSGGGEDVMSEWPVGGSAGSFSVATVGNRVLMFLNNTSTYKYSNTNALAAGTWTHVVYVKKSTTNFDVYINGVLDDGASAGSIPSSVSAATNDFEIGIGRYNTDFNGLIDDVKIYNRALTSDEVEAQYEAGLAGFNSGLVIPALQPGASQTIDANLIILADAPYSIATSETSPLTLINNSSVTIPSIAGSIASPAAWVEGTTKGLGFTVLSGPTGVPSQWGSGANYAAIPANSTTFYSRTGFSGGTKDVIGLQYRLDVNANQQAGDYKNNVVYTATITP